MTLIPNPNGGMWEVSYDVHDYEADLAKGQVHLKSLVQTFLDDSRDLTEFDTFVAYVGATRSSEITRDQLVSALWTAVRTLAQDTSWMEGIPDGDMEEV